MTAEQLRHLRESRDLTRDELASELQCSASAIVHWEGGKRSIPAWVEEKMLRKVKVEMPLEDLDILLEHARATGKNFQQVLGDALRRYLRDEQVTLNVRPEPASGATLRRGHDAERESNKVPKQ